MVQQTGSIEKGLQFYKREQWIGMLSEDDALYTIIAVCLQDKPEQRWKMKKIREKLGELSKNELPQLMDIMKENEIMKEQMSLRYGKSTLMKSTLITDIDISLL